MDGMEGYTEAVERELARLRAELKRTQDELAITKGDLFRAQDSLIRHLTVGGEGQPGPFAKAA